MLQLKNTTPFAAHFALLPDVRGIDTLYVAIKATFSLGARLELADPQLPVVLADEYWGEPGQSSIKYASDVHLTKLSTDIALVGQAHSPEHKPVTELDVSLSVADRKKVVRVYGDRTWRSGFAFIPASATAPEPFTSMPLVYERAFGGLHELEGKKPKILFEPRNPVGHGFVGKRKGRHLKGLPLPNLEDPKRLIRGKKHRPAPAGFGFISPAWEPRKSFAGTYDDAWLKQRAPYLPTDFDPRFFSAAHPDLVTGRYLEGGEKVEAVNVTPSGVLEFKLPTCQITASVRIAGRTEKPPLNLETVLIEPDESRVSLLWRGAVSCDKRTLKVEEIELKLERLMLDGEGGLMPGADILGIGMMTSVGVGAAQTATSVHAGIARVAESAIHNRRFEPIVMSTLPDEELPPLEESLEQLPGLTSRQLRMLRLAGPALSEAVADVGGVDAVPLLLAVPEAWPERADPAGPKFLEHLAKQSGVGFQIATSRMFPNGRAAGFVALAEALALLEGGEVPRVLLGGVDSYLDLYLLATLDAEDRILAEGVMDGFAPGEGAAFLLLGPGGGGGARAIARVVAAATGVEAGHRYSEEPYRGDGLAATFQSLFATKGAADKPVASVLAGFNGENFGAKEWGTAYLRSKAQFVDDIALGHPVDCFGDAGAALGPLLLGLGAIGIQKGYQREPCLAWCSSDREERGAALLRSASS